MDLDASLVPLPGFPLTGAARVVLDVLQLLLRQVSVQVMHSPESQPQAVDNLWLSGKHQTVVTSTEDSTTVKPRRSERSIFYCRGLAR